MLPVSFGERIADGPGHGILDPLVRIAGPIADIDGKGAALAFQHRRIAQQFCDPRAVECCRHDQELQVRSQGRLHIERQRKAEIRVEAALVKLIEEHGGDVFQVGIVEDHSGENAFGDDEDARFRRDLVFKPHAIADGCADLLAHEARHAAGGGARGKAARFEQDDRAVLAPWCTKQDAAERGLSCLRRAERQAPPHCHWSAQHRAPERFR